MNNGWDRILGMTDEWDRILELMDQVPEGERRLCKYVAWAPQLGCGCVWGTLYPGTPRSISTPLSLDFGAMSQAQNPTDPIVKDFQAWITKMGISPLSVSILENINDHLTPSVLSLEGLWARVYEAVRYRSSREVGDG